MEVLFQFPDLFRPESAKRLLPCVIALLCDPHLASQVRYTQPHIGLLQGREDLLS